MQEPITDDQVVKLYNKYKQLSTKDPYQDAYCEADDRRAEEAKEAWLKALYKLNLQEQHI